MQSIATVVALLTLLVANSSAASLLQNDSTSSSISIGGSPRLTIVSSSGNVGILTTSPNSTLQVSGSIAANYTLTTSTAYSVLSTDYTIIANPSSAGTVTLPTAASITGRKYTIKNISANLVTLNTTSSQTIDGSTTYLLPNQYQYVTVVSNGSNWNVVAAAPLITC